MRAHAIFFIALSWLNWNCSSSEPEPDLIDSLPSDALADVPTRSKVVFLLGDAARADGEYEYMSKKGEEFLFIRAGYLFSNNEKQAVVVYEGDNNKVYVDIHYQVGGGWMNMNDTTGLPRPGPAFNVVLEDFNFDGMKDVFVVESVSNGYAMQRGYLYTTDSSRRTKYFLTPHKEVNGIANPTTDRGKQVMTSDSIIYCKGIENICKTEYRWADSLFVRGSTECPCKGD